MPVRKISLKFLFWKVPQLLSLCLVIGGLITITWAAQKIQTAISRAEQAQTIVLEGYLQAAILDDFNSKKATIEYYLNTKQELIQLQNFSIPPQAKPGDKVKISGKTLASALRSSSIPAATLSSRSIGTLELDSPKIEVIEATALTSDYKTGNQKIAVLLLNFIDQPITSPTPQAASTLINGDVKNFYLENSFQKLNLTTDIYGPFNLSVTKTCNLRNFFGEAVQLADQQVDFTRYKFVVLAFPGDANQCGFSGVSFGGLFKYQTNDGEAESTFTFILAPNFDFFTISHELGHSLGGWHANGWECGTLPVGGNCRSIRYGNLWEMLGFGAYHFNPYHKSIFGWLPPGSQLIYDPNQPQPNYVIYPIEDNTSQSQAIRINLRDGWQYYIETRRRVGFDSQLSPYMALGIIIELICPDADLNPEPCNTGDTQTIDTTPNSNSDELLDFLDPPLLAGQTFYDPEYGLTIRLEEKRPDGAAVVRISGNTPPITPTIDPTPTITPTPTPVPTAIPTSTPSPTPSPTPIPGNFWGLDATLPAPGGSQPYFSFYYSERTSWFYVDVSTSSDFSADVYQGFTDGPYHATDNQLYVDNPTKWSSYSCGKTIYWKVRTAEGLESPIQTAQIWECGGGGGGGGGESGRYSRLSANLEKDQSGFNFKYVGYGAGTAWAFHRVALSTDSQMSTDVYYPWDGGYNSPIISDWFNPRTVWDKYRCDRDLYWRINLYPYAESAITHDIVECPPTFNTKSLPSGKTSVPYPTTPMDFRVSDRLEADRLAPLDLRFERLPEWLTIEPCAEIRTSSKVSLSCPVSGTPPAAGKYSFTAVATDKLSRYKPSKDYRKNYSIKIKK